jgi:hypothetical protein
MSSPPHACLRWRTVIGDEDGCPPTFSRLQGDHETAWRLDRIDGNAPEGAGPSGLGSTRADDRFR